MNTKINDFLEQLKDAEMVLIGIGEEFDNVKALRNMPGYNKCRDKIDGSDNEWLVPAVNLTYERNKSDAYDVLNKFAEIIAEKNYFVVSVSTNERIRDVSWREKRLVMPCGGSLMKQCVDNCGHELSEITEADWGNIKNYMDALQNEEKTEVNRLDLGCCPKCGSPLVINSIYTKNYDENGYLPQWQLYTKWLQGSLNRKLVVVEMGVGMQCPSVIRWPFEKIAFFNQKATFWRINERLYQLSEELNGKGTSIAMNAIDWLRYLC